MSTIHEPSRRERYRAVLPPVHQADVAVLARHRLERDRLVIRRPALFERLSRAARVTQLSAPAGSGKTHLLRSWVDESGLAGNAAWVSVERDERDPQRFWVALVDALRTTEAGDSVLREIRAVPDLDLCGLAEHLGSLEHPVWLVIDGLHELHSDDALRQLELFLLHAPDRLRVVLSSRHELRLGLHRLRLEGALTEIRSGDLAFTQDEAGTLFASAGVELPESVLGALLERTEGWAAGLRLAALSLSGHADPEQCAAEFSGSERTVADYLLAEVLDRQPPEVRRLLLRTSMLQRVNGALAECLTGEPGAERILHELEESGAFVLALDTRRSWFRYHRLFAELLQLELRRTEPDAVAGLHRAAAQWLADHGDPVDAVRHARAARDWSLAARIISDHWFGLELGGQAAPPEGVLAAFSPGAVADDAELAALTGADQLRRGALQEAGRYCSVARHALASVPPERRRRVNPLLVRLRLLVARTSGELSAAIEEAQRLLEVADPSGDASTLDPEPRALTLITLGSAELRAGEVADAERHLDEGIVLARCMDRPYLEIFGLGWSAQLAGPRSTTVALDRATQAIELARQHGWSEEPIVSPARAALAAAMVWQGRLEEARSVLEDADTTARSVSPAGGLVQSARGLLELARGRHQAAVDAFRAAQRLDASVVTPLASRTGGFLLQTLVAMGELASAEQALTGRDEPRPGAGEARIALAALRLAQGDPDAATTALAPLLDGFAHVASTPVWAVQAFLLQALAHDALGDAGGAERALERALDLAEPDGLLLPFLLHPEAARLLERHSRHRTTHASLISAALALLTGRHPAAVTGRRPLREPLSESETRVLRYLPTNLSKREIASELCVSVHTVKTHIHHLFTKLDVHSRGEAVMQARGLGLLAPSACK
jgi:LuxR family transcriptional regulator, maltose regulon positive regulatory protein